MHSYRSTPARLKSLVCALLLLMLSGCWNGETISVSLGDVSLGQQLMDLKTALDAGALTQTEYVDLKAKLLSLTDLCKTSSDESGDVSKDKS